MPAHNMKAPKQPQEDTSQTKIDVTSKFPVGGISLAILIRTDATQPKGGKGAR